MLQQCQLRGRLFALNADHRCTTLTPAEDEDFARMRAGWHGGISTRSSLPISKNTHIHARAAGNSFMPTAMHIESIAPMVAMSVPALVQRQVPPVNDAMFQSEKLCQSTLAAARSMLTKAIITPEEFVRIRNLLVEKYHPPISSLSLDRSET